MSILVSAHNPMTGPRHLGHHVSTMKEWPSLQDRYECFLVVDDLIANFMYPAARDQVLNRSLYTARDFLACGVDPKKVRLVFTSTLWEVSELLVLMSRYVDVAYCQRLYEHSFLGMLAPHQRHQMGLPTHPSVIELLYPQLALPTLTLSLGADAFQGGEEISGYVYIMREMAARINAELGGLVRAPEWRRPATPYLSGTDGNHMVSSNAVYVSESYDDLKRSGMAGALPGEVLCEWAEAIGQPALARDYDANPGEGRRRILEAVDAECRRYRDFSITNEEILEHAAAGAARAKFLLRGTLGRLKERARIMDLVEY